MTTPSRDVIAAVLPDADLDRSPLATATVTGDGWVAAAQAVRDDPRTACTWPDFLAASDEVPRRDGDVDGFAVTLRVWSPEHRRAVFLRTVVERSDPRLATLTGLWPGLAWHERETAELHGVVFVGHPDPRPLLLPDTPDAPKFPLRKLFELSRRDESSWPGAADPAGARGRPPRPHRLVP